MRKRKASSNDILKAVDKMQKNLNKVEIFIKKVQELQKDLNDLYDEPEDLDELSDDEIQEL